VAGALLAPLAPGLLFFVLSLLGRPAEGFWALKLSALITYPAMLVLGVPAHLLLVKRGWTTGWSYALTGVVIGIIVAAVMVGNVVINNISFAPDPNKSLGPSEAIFIMVALLGALTAWVFWLIAQPNDEAR
jgi:hypothetical protein